MRTRPLFFLLISLAAVPVFADDVYLTNGRKFEGVIAETTDSQVRIRMQGGVLSLPKSQVLRVEEGDSNLAEYLHRKEALRKNPAASASDWLELALWARGKDLGQAARESALTAAALDPHLAGLAPILRGYGYVLDEQLDRWIPYEESMRRKGFVLANGQWITREEYAARVRAREQEDALRRAAYEERARAAREDRLAALTELTLTRELARSAAPTYPLYANPFYGAPVVVIPGFWVLPRGPMDPHRHGQASSEFTHVPGSLIGGKLFPSSKSH
ncbi:MAG TPA: hypothetical protein VGX68_22735 [Thermoanaerobaculia bacterium]|jgi:hypothetical protein|nr:hypothetical protein [Thermoanaerobaculia bacterium]